jgi:hypothetical protein
MYVCVCVCVFVGACMGVCMCVCVCVCVCVIFISQFVPLTCENLTCTVVYITTNKKSDHMQLAQRRDTIYHEQHYI